MREYPYRWVVLETVVGRHRSQRKSWDHERSLRLGTAKSCRWVERGRIDSAYLDFYDSLDFFGSIMAMPKLNHPIYIFAHECHAQMMAVRWFAHMRGGKLSNVPPPDMPGAYRFGGPLMVCDSGHLMIRFFRPDGQQIIFLDIQNWVAKPVHEMGEWLKMPLGRVPDRRTADDEAFEWCRQSVDIQDRTLRRLWGWMEGLDIRSFEMTPGSQAMRLYQIKYEKKRIVRPKDPNEMSWDRAGYYGGQVECYRLGRVEGMAYQLDVNGLFPRILYEHPFPCAVSSRGDNHGKPIESIHFDPRMAMAEVWLDSPQAGYPVRCAEGTTYLRGRVRTVLPGPELARAWARGHVVGVGRWVLYRCDNLFRAYVGYWWRHRRKAQRDGDRLVDHICKFMMNCLYGKFGQRAGDWEEVCTIPKPGAYGGGKFVGRLIEDRCEFKVVDSRLYERNRRHEHRDAFVPIAAFTTSYSRVFMDEIRDMVGPEHVYYQCIDSIWVDGTGLGRLQLTNTVDNGKLGGWKLERSVEGFHIMGPNQVEWSGGWTHSGIKGDAVPIAPGTYQYTEYECLDAALNSGDIDAMGVRQVIRRPKVGYSKREILPDGTTRPFAVDNWHLTPEDMRKTSFKSVLWSRE